MLSETKTMQMVFDDLRSNRPKPLKSCNFNSLPMHKRFLSLPNIDVLTNSASKAIEIRWKSTPVLMVPEMDDILSTILQASKSCDVHSLLLLKRCVTLPNMDLLKNSAFEIRLPTDRSAELLVSTDSSCAGSSIPTIMPSATAEDDCGIETPLSISSSLPQVIKIESSVRLMKKDYQKKVHYPDIRHIFHQIIRVLS
ncbi:hypothetical protein QTP88_027291 [Uroleucon formosanum]